MKKTMYIWALGLALPLLLSSCNSKNAAENTSDKDSTAVATVSEPQTDDETAEDKQEEENWKRFGEWASKPLTAKAKDGKVSIHDFAQAFCQEYSDFEPCEQLLNYLKDPENYDGGEEKYFFVRDVPKDGYIECGWRFETVNAVTLCFWNRTNGHLLVGATVERSYDGSEHMRYQYMFYDYDKATGKLTPDQEVAKAFDKFAAQYDQIYAYLPEEGKDCYVYAITYGDDEESEEDDTFKDFYAKWDGMTFTIVPSEW